MSNILTWYALASAAAFVAYGLDKKAAQQGRRRTPERTLHLLALLGGWPGAFAAQKFFHHKTKQQKFQTAYWLSVIANSLALAGFGLIK